jgi:hypothetical protein
VCSAHELIVFMEHNIERIQLGTSNIGQRKDFKIASGGSVCTKKEELSVSIPN